jgi:hypothetical protein
MKPRICRRQGVWLCARIEHFGRFGGAYFRLGPIGHGYSPREAYDDWKAQQ